MASPSTSQAVAKRSQETALMPPPPRPKRVKRPAKVLDEDDYTDALSHIIARDFFPGLLETETKQEYLNALDSQDPQWIAAAGKRLTEVMTPGPDGRRIRGRRGTDLASHNGATSLGGETPRGWQGDTPGSVTSVSTSATSQTRPEKSDIDTNMSLSAFQEKYTSEDNESFYKLLDKQNEKRSEKFSWMWADNKIPAARQIAHRKRQALLKAKEDAEAAENDGKQLAVVEPKDARPAMPDTWKSKPNNSLMFNPDSIEDSLQTVAQKNQETSTAPPKAVNYDNTRLPTSSTANTDNDHIIPPSPSLSAVRDAIAGDPPHSETSSFTGGLTPRVNGYAFVDDREPSPPPPPTTTDESLRLLGVGDGDGTPNPFTISSSSRREALHHRMVEKVARQKRTASVNASASNTPHRGDSDLRGRRTPSALMAATPRFMSSPMIRRSETSGAVGGGGSRGGLTPAGERLMGKVGGGSTPGRLGAGGTRTTGSLWEREVKTPKTKGGAGRRLREGWTPKA